MKKLVIGLTTMVLVSSFSFAQTKVENWKNMMEKCKNSIDEVLIKECPQDLDINKYKTSLINGSHQLSEKAQNEIKRSLEPLIDYGSDFANSNGLTSLDESSLVFYSSFPPDFPVSDGQFVVGTNGLTWGEVGTCALNALGADALYSLAFSGASSWSIGALTSAFSGVARRFLGPIGVGIAVVSFGLCLANEAGD